MFISELYEFFNSWNTQPVMILFYITLLKLKASLIFVMCYRTC